MSLIPPSSRSLLLDVTDRPRISPHARGGILAQGDPCQRNDDGEDPPQGCFQGRLATHSLATVSDLPPFPGSTDERDDESESRRSPRVPGWVIFVVIAVAAVIAVVLLHLTGIMGGGLHGGSHGG